MEIYFSVLKPEVLRIDFYVKKAFDCYKVVEEFSSSFKYFFYWLLF